MEDEIMKSIKQALIIVAVLCALAFALGCLAKESAKAMTTCKGLHSTYRCHELLNN